MKGIIPIAFNDNGAALGSDPPLHLRCLLVGAVQGWWALWAVRKQLSCAATDRTLLTGKRLGGQPGDVLHRSWRAPLHCHSSSAPSGAPLAPIGSAQRTQTASAWDKPETQSLHKADLAAWTNRNQDLDKSKWKLKLCRNWRKAEPWLALLLFILPASVCYA